ncbi:disulfide bond formation protein B [Stappia sp. ES.058]|uniref:disulfide bond formation protein B n=1 Tax=Stappia sp. ES.058 TaxID=1881061 RepID=UPI00087D89E3|nr:disulfide bond formation protein B [Stappia sp. ES.058]SDU07477.1 Disulfide bond formation protein DsbB [Stappia sp. ES.058]
MISHKTEGALNVAALFAISAVLLVAFADQIIGGELPCPLCLLQRAGFLLLAIGPVLTVARGPHPAHYGVTVLAGLIGAGFAMRQVLLHIQPGDAGYGAPFLGLHFYTWAFVIFAAAIAASAAMLLLRDPSPAQRRDAAWPAFGSLAVGLVVLLAAANAASTALECGQASCPDNPTFYELLR